MGDGEASKIYVALEGKEIEVRLSERRRRRHEPLARLGNCTARQNSEECILIPSDEL
jgi:hypothetical protein